MTTRHTSPLPVGSSAYQASLPSSATPGPQGANPGLLTQDIVTPNPAADPPLGPTREQALISPAPHVPPTHVSRELPPPPCLLPWSYLGTAAPIDLKKLSQTIQERLLTPEGQRSDAVFQWVENPENLARLVGILSDNPLDPRGLGHTIASQCHALFGIEANPTSSQVLKLVVTLTRKEKYGDFDRYLMQHTREKRWADSRVSELLETPFNQYAIMCAVHLLALDAMDPTLALAMMTQAVDIITENKTKLNTKDAGHAMAMLAFAAVNAPNITPEEIRELHRQSATWEKVEAEKNRTMLPPSGGIIPMPIKRHFNPGDRPRVGIIMRDDLEGRSVISRFSNAWLTELRGWADVEILDYNKYLNARKVANGNFDAIMDLEGPTHHGRPDLIAGHTAPVRICYLGYASTLGHPQDVFRIVDNFTDGPGRDHLSTETIIRVPHGPFLCYTPVVNPPLASEPPCVKKGYVSFGYFGNPNKLHRGIFEDWKKILDQCTYPQEPERNARLVLRYASISTEAIYAMADAVGIPRDRLMILPRAETDEGVLTGYDDHVDIALDSYPYGGTTTTVEALSRGVPVITCTSDERHAANVGASLLTAVLLTDFIGTNREEYIAKAIALANDVPRIISEKRTLPDRTKASLCNADAFNTGFQPLLKTLIMGTATTF